MADDEPLRSRIKNSNSYNELLSLREQVWTMSGKMEFSKYVELRKVADDRISDFENPVCDEVEITIVMENGEKKGMDIRECRIAREKGPSVPKYIFGKYPRARDVVINPPSSTVKKKDGGQAQYDPRLGILQNKIEKVIKLANYMNKTYGEVLPRISEDLNDLVVRLETLYKRVVEKEQNEQ